MYYSVSGTVFLCLVLLSHHFLFPSPPFPTSTSTQTVGHDLFSKRAQEIQSELFDYYNTYIDILKFSDEAWDLLRDLAQSLVAVRFQSNSDLMTLFFDLFTGYLKLHLLAGRVENCRLMLSAYAHAHHLNHGNTEPNFMRIATYVNEHEKPILKLRQQCENLMLDAATLHSFFQPLAKYQDPKILMDTKLFDLVHDEKSMDVPSHLEEMQELLYLDRFVHWTLYSFLFAPRTLQDEKSRGLLQVALGYTYQLPIYRDVMLDLYHEYDTLFEKFRLDKFKLSKHKKEIFKDILKTSHLVYDRHRRLRGLLSVTLHTVYFMFSDFPGLIAPKIQLVLTLLRMARNEIVWYCQNIGVKPYKAPKQFPSGDNFIDGRVTTLIYFVDHIQQLVSKNKDFVHDYYLDLLRGPDAARIHPIAESFFKSARLSVALHDMLADTLNAISDASDSTDFEAIRLNWYRLSASLSSQQSGVTATQSEPLTAAMSKILTHSRHIDRLESELITHGSLHELLWYRNHVQEMLMAGLSDIHGQPGHCMSIVRVVHHSLANIHRFAPEEQKIIGAKTTKMAELFLKKSVDQVIRLLNGICTMVDELRAQTAPVQVARAMEKSGTQAALPGHESRHMIKNSLAQSLRAWRQQLAEICTAIREVESIVVFNVEYHPREYLCDTVEHTFKVQLHRKVCVGKGIQRPSIMLTHIKDLIRTFTAVDQHININVHDMIRRVMFQEFVDLTAGTAGEPQEIKTQTNTDNPGLIHTIAAWYIALLTSDLGAQQVTYSDLKDGFVPIPNASSKSFPADTYADICELRALAELVGPYGVRIFDRELLSRISTSAGRIKSYIGENAHILKSLGPRFAEREFWSDSIGNLVHIPELVREATSVGSLMKFRRLLQYALKDVLQRDHPFVFGSVSELDSMVSGNDEDHRVQALLSLSADCGIPLGGADHALRHFLKRHKANGKDQTTWQLLPELFAVSLIDNTWKQSQYLVATESHSNNAHTIAICAVNLIAAFNDIPTEVKMSATAAECTQSDMLKLIRYSSYSVLHMSIRGSGSNFSNYNMQSVRAFVEKLVAETDIVSISEIEDFFPFSLLRTNYIQMYEKQSHKGHSYAAVIEDDA
jgi:NCK-associated protein 1